MTLHRMDHVGIVVEDLDAATEFFVALGLELQGDGEIEGRAVDGVVGLQGVRTRFAFMQTPDGHGRLEIITFRAPSDEGNDGHEPANVPGLRHIAFVVDDVEATLAGLQERGAELVGSVERFGEGYILCYVRGPEG